MSQTTVKSGQVRDDTITNADVSPTAGIVASKLDLTLLKADNLLIVDPTDTSKKLAIDVSGVSTATTRTLTIPNASGTIARIQDHLGVFATTSSSQLAGVISDETGSGFLVFGTSPTLTSPVLKGVGVATLTDGATVSLNAALGNHFYLTAAGDRTISVPTNATDGQKIVIVHKASGADRTLTLTTGSSGAFRFGTDITALTATTSGTTDYIGCIYNGNDSRWDVVAYAKGY